MSHPVAATAGVYALLADGSTVQIRAAAAGDFAAVKAMHEAMSPDNAYLRFFSTSRTAAEREARRVTREPRADHAALLALYGAEVVGVASYEVVQSSGGKTAEVAFAVADTMHHRGIATLLLEHLVSLARARRIESFTAETLSENISMLRVFSDAGLPARSARAEGVVTITIPLPADDTGKQLEDYLDTVALRERSANVASLRPVFDPKSVAVVGASRRRGSVGRSVLDNVRTCGYRGQLYAVNPNASQIGGVPCFPDVASLPETPELALLAVPPPAVPDVAEACGARGVRGLVVFTTGIGTAESADLLAICRRHGMRLIGPNCFGIAVPGIGLDATFAAAHPAAGTAGLVMQSGGIGFAMVDHLSRLGIGISSFASVGNKLDVSSNDMLMWWEQDGQTKLAVLYIESFGNPRKFARTARRVGARLPVLTVHAGRSEAGQQAAASHTAAIATPLVSREALFEQAGIIATPGFGELVEATALLAAQPAPVGRSVAIVSNVGGAGVLAADACTDLGLAVYHPRGQVKRKLHALVPGGGAVAGPVDTTATVSRDDFRQVLELIAADEDVDALIALVLPTGATGDLVAAIQEAAIERRQSPITLTAVVLNQAETVRLLDAKNGKVPAYGYPEAAAGALARAARYGEWRSAPHTPVPGFGDVDAAGARAVIRGFLARAPEGGWLPPADVTALLRLYGIPLVSETRARAEDDAVAAATAVGYPVVVKADVPGLVHKTDAGAVLLDLRTDDDVRAGYRQLAGQFGARLAGVLVEPMITGGTEVIIGVQDDQMFGPLVVFGLGGVATEVLADHAARLAPLTETDADTLINSIRSAPLLHGHRGSAAADIPALRDVLMRVSRLADDLPEVTELDLNPVIARQLGAVAVDARIRVTPQVPQDPFLRRLQLTCRPRSRPDEVG
ncbi:MAG TPA: bifunctional GNAT family N-acetyltransferase/acetate--CoA ligase family protein [Trebonia sp.]|nr:bifunctional GNAT family N-acetyltransferase/acetate--CoA ligase family protein [Trebonia sp.]